MRHSDMLPLYDSYWEPFWATCEQRGLAIVVHAGFGSELGAAFPQVERMYDDVAKVAPSESREDMIAHAYAVSDESLQYFGKFFERNMESRRPLWQMMLGGVFDRYPDLKLLLSEIRVDWVPETIAHLDSIYESRRDDFPAKSKPSEYWERNCLAGASFIHKSEVEMRHEIGVETLLFGRDYPHPEGTWPHTREWLRAAFVGVPEDELRLILGGNAVRFFGLDEDRLAAIAKRIGPTVAEVVGGQPVRSELLENFELRGGFFKPAERGEKLDSLDEAMVSDLEAVIR
jgi:predicted TIM-barrel fold metal-dependent hydrolase